MITTLSTLALAAALQAGPGAAPTAPAPRMIAVQAGGPEKKATAKKKTKKKARKPADRK